MNSPTSLLANQTAWSTSFQSPPLPITVLASDPRKLRQLLDSSEKNSQKIVALESKVREQQKLIQDYEKQQTELTLKLDRANRCMSLMNQPSKYLLSRLNEMEVEHGVMEKRLKELEYENAEAAKIKASLELEISQLKERLQLLLSQRNEIHSLKAMLEALRQEESQESEDDGSDAEEDDEKHVPPPTLTFPQSIPEFTPMKTSNQNESFPPFTPSHQSLLKEPRTPLSPSSTVVMEATRPVSATDLGLSPAAMRSMLERTHPTPSKKRITES